MLKVARAAFAVACFRGFSDVHECTGRLQMAAYPLDKQTAGCNSPHDWLIISQSCGELQPVKSMAKLIR